MLHPASGRSAVGLPTVLLSVMFKIFINDLDKRIEFPLKQFPADNKLSGSVDLLNRSIGDCSARTLAYNAKRKIFLGLRKGLWRECNKTAEY